MKEIYKRFSALKIDPKIDPMHVEKEEKDKVKSLKLKKRRNRHFIRNTVVAAALLSLSLITFSIAFPAIAAQMPIISSMFSLFQGQSQVVNDYAPYTSEIGMTKESNGVKVTVTDAVYDGETVSIAYTMDSNTDLGWHPELNGLFTVKEQGEDAYTPVRYMTERIEGYKYAGVFLAYLMSGEKPETINVEWQGNAIRNTKDKRILKEGEWSFEFELQAIDHETVDLVGIEIEDQGFQVNVDKITNTPVSNVIYLAHDTDQALREKWNYVSLDFKISDNLGNEYDVLPNIGYGVGTHAMTWRIMTQAFDPNATSITITPEAYVFNDPQKDMETLTLKAIEVPLGEK